MNLSPPQWIAVVLGALTFCHLCYHAGWMRGFDRCAEINGNRKRYSWW